MALTPGTRLGPYEVSAQIGVGGMGEVYKATDTNLKRAVAIKVLPASVASDPERLARFQREAEVLAALNHPNIAAIYGLERSGTTTALVMELVEGPTLADRIAQGAVPIDEALPIAKQIADALEAAHEQGIIHRDLKPANVKVRADGTVKVLDFGLAKAMEPTGAMSLGVSMSPTITSPAMMTGIGMILGTAAYMSPEQARGKTVDTRADIWAFGCVLYEMLTGKRAFPGEDVTDTLAAVVKLDPKWDAIAAAVPARVLQATRVCLQKDLRQRAQAIGDVRLALEGRFETEVAHRPGTTAPPSPAGWRRALMPATALIAGGAIVGGAVWFATRPTPPRVVRTEIMTAGAADLSIQGTDRDLAITPDGSRIVYRGVNQLLVRALDQFAPTALTAVGARSPFISPDGQWLGFFDGQNQLKKVALAGGPPVTLATANGFPEGATWGDDGMIVWATGEGEGSGLHRVSAAGGNPTVLTTPDRQRGEGAHLWPEFLPGGQAVLFTITPAIGGLDNAQVAVLDLRTNSQTVLLRGGHHAQYVPTGHLVYGTGNTLRAIAFDLKGLQTLGTPVPVVEQVLASALGGMEAAVAANGTLVYLSGMTVTADRVLAIVDRNGTRQKLNARPGPYRSPSVSPDGTRVALQSSDSNGQSAIWVYDLSGSTAVRQLRGEGNNIRPLWTPDGRYLTFASDRDGSMSLYWQLADGTSEAERLTRAEAGTEHWPESWSPDGRTLAYTVRKAPDGALWTLSLDHPDTPTLFAEAAGLQNGAAFAPNGRWLAYTTQEVPSGIVGAGADIYVQPFPPTGAKYPITRADKGEGGAIPHWSPDGRTLFYRRPTVGNQVFAVDINTASGVAFSNERPLNIRGFSIVQFFRDYDITRDGKFVMLFPSDFDESRELPRPQMHVVLNWTEELKRLVPTK